MMDLARGLGDLRRAFAFLNRHRRLWGWVLAPALATLLLLGGLIAVVVLTVYPAVHAIEQWLPWLGDKASWLLWTIVVGGMLAGGWLMFVRLAGLVAGPLCEMLSEAVEEKLTGVRGAPFSAWRFVRDAAIGAAHSIRRLAVAVLGFAVVFAMSFVPVVGTIAAIALGGWIAARGAAYDSYDGVLARRRLAYRDKLAYLAEHRARTFGLGVAVAAMLLVPGLNLIALGLGTTAATIAVHELEQR